MSLEEFADMMPDTVLWERAGAADAYGQPTFPAAPVEVAARVVGRNTLIRAFDGQERVSTVQVYPAKILGIGPADRITLPERFVPRQPPIMAVARQSDEGGAHHEVIYT